MALNSFSRKVSPASGAPKATKGLKTSGVSKRDQGHFQEHDWAADRRVKNFDTRDRGPGSAFAMALLRNEAIRVKAERKVPGALGYKEPVDISHITHRTIIKGSKKK
jgi:hypothetical protein